jgi:exodeoxyribonuclease V gamma subunit
LTQWSLQDELIRAQAAGPLTDDALADARETRMAAIRRRGDLVTGGFGDRQSDALLEPMDRLFKDWRTQLERWPVEIERDREIRFQADSANRLPLLADWLGQWRSSQDGATARLLLSTRALVDGNQYRYGRLVGPWVEHLAANLAEPVTTVVVSKKGTVEIAPLDVGAAATHLNELMHLWADGMTRPLPFALETALKWLFENQSAPESADAKARAKYEGDAFSVGEMQQSASLQRVYPSFAALASSGEFAELAKRVLEPLTAAVVRKKNSRAAAAGADA